MKTRIMLIEDQAALLKHQVRLFEGRDDVDVVATALSAEGALEWLAAHPEVEPQVVLLDLGLPGISGIEATRALRAARPGLEVLIFTAFDEEEKVLAAIQNGAAGYLLKGAAVEQVVQAIQEIKLGGSVIQPHLARKLLRHFQPPRGVVEPEGQAPRRELSPRELEILQLIAKGASNAEVASALKVSRATVRTHLEHIYDKLDVSNRVEAVTEGIRKGIIGVS